MKSSLVSKGNNFLFFKNKYNAIKEQLRHKNINMTMRYAHLIPNKRNKITENLKL